LISGTDSGKAAQLDQQDPLGSYRAQFYHPHDDEGNPYLYLCGNSLGLQPKTVSAYVQQELDDWARLGVEGHLHAHNPWLPYHEFLTPSTARLVGAKPEEVVVMNTLTVNLHLLMASFYRPTPDRYKIIIESDAFPSDLFAVESQIKHHGFDPESALIRAFPRKGDTILEEDHLCSIIREHGESVALVMIGGVNYYTGQFFDIRRITAAAHEVGAKAGWDLAHAAGNVPLQLHEWNVDFACWCSYKYLNSGPGGLSGAFIHERQATDPKVHRFAGWWGHNKETRFGMRDDFDPIPTAEGWQLSNPPILPLASLRASMEIFDEVGMDALRQKSETMTAYFISLLDELGEDVVRVITPREAHRRGCQISIQVQNADKRLFEAITDRGVIADWREPDVIRTAPVPLYNSYKDIDRFVQILKNCLS